MYIFVDSGASVYNLYDDEEESDNSSNGHRDKGQENDTTKEKMKLLRSKMADLNISKKVLLKPILFKIL